LALPRILAARQTLALVALLTLTLFRSSALANVPQSNDDARVQARDFLKRGTQALKAGQFNLAIEDFKRAKELDPSLLDASLDLATAYANKFIPGSPAQENVELGKQAVQEFKDVLSQDPENLQAIDGIGSVLYKMGGDPFDREVLDEAKQYWQKHIDITPKDPEPYYRVGLIDWTIVDQADRELHGTWSKKNSATEGSDEPMPEGLRQKFQNQFETIINDGIEHMKQAILLRPDYDDAMAYLNLLYRVRAQLEPTAGLRDADLREADELVDQATKIKKQKMASSPQ
jgi:tetratricopeptide (TPR) repeat protein